MHRIICFIIALAVVAPAVAQQTVKQPAARDSSQTKASPASVIAPPDCACDLPLPDVLAVVNGVKLTQQDLNPETQKRIAELHAEVAAARSRELELQINSMLLEAEAKRLKLSTQKLLENEVVAKATEPTEADAQSFYDANKARIQNDFAKVKDDIIVYLRDQRQRELAGKFAERLRAAASVQLLVKEVTPPANAAERDRLFAHVNGQRITSADVEDSLLPLIFEMQQQTYDLRKRDIDLKINDILLSAEAQKRQVTTRALLDAEVEAKLQPVTEAQAQTFYNENKARINGEFAQVKAEIIQYLHDAEATRQRLAFAERLRKASALQVFLNPPVPPVLKISTENQPLKGNANAAVTIVAFTDFECKSCAPAQTTLDKLLTEYDGRVRLVVRDYPLTQHAKAQKAAEAAEAARAQGKYWEYAALLYANQSALDVAQLKEYASRIGLDRAKFDAALDGGTFAEEVRRDILDGQRAGVAGTPVIFVNGRRAADSSYETLKTAIEAALKTAPTR